MLSTRGRKKIGKCYGYMKEILGKRFGPPEIKYLLQP